MTQSTVTLGSWTHVLNKMLVAPSPVTWCVPTNLGSTLTVEPVTPKFLSITTISICSTCGSQSTKLIVHLSRHSLLWCGRVSLLRVPRDNLLLDRLNLVTSQDRYCWRNATKQICLYLRVNLPPKISKSYGLNFRPSRASWNDSDHVKDCSVVYIVNNSHVDRRHVKIINPVVHLNASFVSYCAKV